VKTVHDMSMQLIDDTANLPAPPASPPGHTYFDARDISDADNKTGKREREKVRSALLRAAMRLGKQHPVAGSEASVVEGGAAPAPLESDTADSALAGTDNAAG